MKKKCFLFSDGDLRRLVCLICAEQFNGTKFRSMIEHLESAHQKSQDSRSLNLETFVGFGCGHCENLKVRLSYQGYKDCKLSFIA